MKITRPSRPYVVEYPYVSGKLPNFIVISYFHSSLEKHFSVAHKTDFNVYCERMRKKVLKEKKQNNNDGRRALGKRAGISIQNEINDVFIFPFQKTQYRRQTFKL